ncbi:MAG: MFS transporter [Vulcanimicrobiaceae bacterium]
MSASSTRKSVGAWSLLNALWVPLTAQDAALMTIAVPAALLHIAPTSYRSSLSILVSVAALGAMIVPPLAGWLSDRSRRAGGSRRAFVVAGVAVDVAALTAIAFVHEIWLFGALLIVAIAGANVAIAAYQAMLPESVPREHWGIVSGIRGALTLIGTVIGLVVAGIAPDPRITFLAVAAILALTTLSLPFVDEGEWSEPDRAHVRDWHDFVVVFFARSLVYFGLVLLQTYVLFFFTDVFKVTNASGGTVLVALSALVGAVASSIFLGVASDRFPRRIVVSVSGIPMAIAAVGFALAPDPRWMLPFAAAFGLGMGGVYSAGWALAMDSIPDLRDVARDLGLWGIATNLPNVIAPLVGGAVLVYFGGSRTGYQVVFALSGASFALASLAVLRVGATPLSSWGAIPLRAAAILSNAAYVHAAYRVRGWGKLPRKRGATLIVTNHQHDLETMTLVSRITVQSSWRHPVFAASSRRLYEPGFMALRLPFLRNALRDLNAAPLFRGIGMVPLENQVGSRAISGLAWSVQSRHGPLALTDVFDQFVSSKFAPGTLTADLLQPAMLERSQEIVRLKYVREPYRAEILSETRAAIDSDLAAMASILERGGTIFLTAEGRYTTDGRIGRMRGSLDRLGPLAQIYLAGVSYDPFRSGRFSMLYRLVRLDDRDLLVETLAAIRPVTVSQILAGWLQTRDDEGFTDDEAVAGVGAALAGLPETLFVDPDLRRNPRGLARDALSAMEKLGLIERDAPTKTLRRGGVRMHPQFPGVDDIVAHQANFFAETLAGAKVLAVTPGQRLES